MENNMATKPELTEKDLGIIKNSLDLAIKTHQRHVNSAENELVKDAYQKVLEAITQTRAKF